MMGIYKSLKGIGGLDMSDKNIEMMKQFLEKKKAKQLEQQKLRPDKKIGSPSGSKKNQKPGGSNNKV